MNWLRTSLCVSLTACFILALSACGGGGSSSPPQSGTQLAGNWQFTMVNPLGSSFTGGLQGGFLQQNNGSLTGQVVFSLTTTGSTLACNSGTATITGTVSGQTVSFTAGVGTLASDGTPTTQTITLSGGTLSSDNSSIQNGTYTLTAGYANLNGQILPCGTAQDTGTWSAISVPPMTGGFQGFFHSTEGGNGLKDQDFPLNGTFLQGENVGASSATITGTLVFKDPVTGLNDYPCLTTASINGQISGNSVVLQIFVSSGSDVGQIGGIQTFAPVTFDNTQGGYVLHNVGPGANGNGYAVVNTKACPGGSLTTPGDAGNLCLAFNNSTACTQPITLSPVSYTFFPQLLGSVPTTQTFTLTNSDPSGNPVNGLSLKFADNDSDLFYQSGGADFNGLPNFTVVPTGAANDCTTLAPLGSSFDLPGPPNNSCTITVSFSPQESCPWLPAVGNTGDSSGIYWLPPAKCPIPFNPNVAPGSPLVSAGLTVNSPSSADEDKSFYLPVSGTGLSLLVPSTPELDFSAEDVGESSQPQTLTFTNQSPNPVQILPPANTPCSYSVTPTLLPRPPEPGVVGGLQIVSTGGPNNAIISPNPLPPPYSTQYFCDADPLAPAGSGLPNFQISSDTCSGQTLGPQSSPTQSCSLQITFAPQPATWKVVPPNPANGIGLDYFLELNTLWCDPNSNPTPGPTNPCEIDSGRYPVELKTNPPGPLRVSPAAGLNFGTWLKGTTSTPLAITLSSDDADATTASFTSRVIQGTDYLESDTCAATLSPGQSCTLTFTFNPSISGFDASTFTLSYNTASSSGNQYALRLTIYLRGIGE